MSKKSLVILFRARMRPSHPSKLAVSPLTSEVNQMESSRQDNQPGLHASQHVSKNGNEPLNASINSEREFERVRDSMRSAITMSKTEIVDTVLNDFSEGYLRLSFENRRRLSVALAKEYDLNRTQVRDLIKQYLGLELHGEPGEEAHLAGPKEEGPVTAFYRIERNLRHTLNPKYEALFERLNMHPGGLKFLSIFRADVLSILAEENNASLRALESYLKEKLSTWLSPASLELHQITWDDPASLLEKIVAYEAVHPISNLLDLKRRLGVGRRCFGYLHPAIPGEPLIFIEVALLKNVAQTIQEVLWDNPPTPEYEATCALFYSISSTQPGLAGINLGKFLIKRVINLVKRDMPHISTFATLSPIPGYMQWLLSKLASQTTLAGADDISQSPGDQSGSSFRENLLEPEEERALMGLSEEHITGKNGMEVMLNLLTLREHQWSNSDKLLSVLKAPLLRLCARYLLQEKKRGKALDSVANFHLQNGAMIERINWMADLSDKGLRQSGGIMVNYVYRMDSIEEYAQSYFSSGHIHASPNILRYIEQLQQQEATTE